MWFLKVIVTGFVCGFITASTVGYTTYQENMAIVQGSMKTIKDAIANKGGCGAYDPLGTFYILNCKDSAYADIIKAQSMQQDYDLETETIKASMNQKGKKR